MRSSSSAWTEIPSPVHGSVFDLDKRAVMRAVHDQRQRTMELLRALPETDWERIVVPRWRVREFAAHMITTDEGTLTGRILTIGFTKDAVGGIPKIEAWNDKQVARWADRPIAELLAGIEKWGRRLERLAASVPKVIGKRVMPTPFGRVSLLWLAGLRVYDEWVHREDFRRAFGMPSDDDPGVVGPAARMLQAGIPIQSLPRVAGGRVGTVSIAFDDVDLPALGVDLGAKRYGYGVSGGDARIAGRAAPLVMVAARRDTWRDAEASGALKIEGDRNAAEAVLDALLLV
jgi:uncharacterized protein (TIGR03083 family)